ncbi:MAG TPA: ACT domain-containing protein [Epulopiscium sp.]|nr:ACT domain-containing protein [Candidatus Epulonipiscium sp.]
MRGIITVVGKDKVGIIGKVCTLLSDENVNILDISQTIVQGYFNMMMIVELKETDEELDKTIDLLDELGKEIGVDIKLQHESIFNTMHRI